MSISAVKMLLKAIGLDANAIEAKALEGQRVFLEFEMDQLRVALQTMLDYQRNQEQNEMRLLAIMSALNVPDPVVMNDLLQRMAIASPDEEEKGNA